MAVLQRRRGVTITIHPSVETIDRRGNRTIRPLGFPFTVSAWIVPDRASRAEVPGQQEIDVYTIGTKADLTDVDLWSRIEWDGRWWDMVSPPAKHIGTRHTAHWTLTVRKRPDGDGGLNG